MEWQHHHGQQRQHKHDVPPDAVEPRLVANHKPPGNSGILLILHWGRFGHRPFAVEPLAVQAHGPSCTPPSSFDAVLCGRLVLFKDGDK
eukprot:scaffold3466_cov132-Isochrysis_galbana.AAC.6